MKCRHCGANIEHNVIDLGSAPPSNAYLTDKTLHAPETWYPLRILVCTHCWLVQTEDFTGREELFTADYAYYSSFSSTWLAHAECYVKKMIDRFDLDTNSHVVEVAANDGYLLQYMKSRNIPCTGIEPTANTAEAARKKGIPIIEEFFGVRLANELVAQDKQADLTTANNVLAHVPDINNFVAGFPLLLKPHGVATFEFPHLLQLIKNNQFDTIYHEHFSYLSLTAVDRIFETNGLTVFDVEELPTHGGSLRVFAQHSDTGCLPIDQQVTDLLEAELRAGVTSLTYYTNFQKRADKIKNDLITFLLEAKRNHKKVAAYGAAAKGNTLLNYAGIRPDLIAYVVDKNPAKQGKYLPGSRIPILDELDMRSDKPDYVVILPWNLKDEVMNQLEYIRMWGSKFVMPLPELEIL